MYEIIMRFKSGRKFRFKCEEYTIKTFKATGTLSEFNFKGGVGECPIYFQVQDIECIAVIGKEQIEELEQVPCEDCIDRYSALAELDPLSYEYKAIKELPSVVPKRGKWEKVPYLKEWRKCSECGSRYTFPWHYCPNCGARMESDEQ